MPVKLKNNATTTTATAITSVSTSVAVVSGTGALFPTLLSGEYFYATLVDVNGNYEIVKVTARATDVMTIVRAQEGTIAIPFGTGSIFECRITAQSVIDAAAEVAGLAESTLSLQKAKDAAVSGKAIRFKNVCRGGLATAVASSGATSITVDAAAAASAPQSGYFPIKVSTELMMVTAGAGTTTWTVIRGLYSTTALSSIPNNTPIYCGQLSVNFSGTGYPQAGDPSPFVTGGPKIYPTPQATTAATTALWQSPNVWTPSSTYYTNPFPAVYNAPSPSTTLYLQMYSQETFPNAISPGDISAGMMQYHFTHDGQYFETLQGGAVTVAYWVVTIDEGEGPFYPTVAPMGGFSNVVTPGNWAKWNFGSRATRKISMFLSGQSTGFTGVMSAISVPTTDVIGKWDRTGEIRAAAFTDSYGQQLTYNWAGGGGIFTEACAELGINIHEINAVGGSGYYADTTGAFTGNGLNGVARLPYFQYFQPDILITNFGINDAAASPPPVPTNVVNAVNSYYAQFRTYYPNAVAVTLGSFCPIETNLNTTTRSYTAMNAVIKAAVATMTGPWVFINVQGSTQGGLVDWYNSSGASGRVTSENFFTGNGRVGTTTGTGNGDLYLSADGTHPSILGAQAISRYIATAMRRAIIAI
jgi:lysophospholipase L1-like esterase